MKGLLLKDWYMAKKYCRAYLLVAAVFVVLACVTDDSTFFVFYPCLLCGMLPVTLLGYDERSRWLSYSTTLPYTRSQIVSAKYLMGLFAQLIFWIITGTAQGIKMALTDTFRFSDFSTLILLLLTVSAFTSSICLPFSFKLGVEKGRTAYYVMIGFVCAASMVASKLLSNQIQVQIHPQLLLGILALAGVGVYSLSWYLSVVFYKKREIT